LAKECPTCGLINPDATPVCDCGFDFEARTGGKRPRPWQAVAFVIGGGIHASIMLLWRGIPASMTPLDAWAGLANFLIFGLLGVGVWALMRGRLRVRG
jgi:hypothetical protein